jgi:hypothetical protein
MQILEARCFKCAEGTGRSAPGQSDYFIVLCENFNQRVSGIGGDFDPKLKELRWQRHGVILTKIDL